MSCSGTDRWSNRKNTNGSQIQEVVASCHGLPDTRRHPATSYQSLEFPAATTCQEGEAGLKTTQESKITTLAKTLDQDDIQLLAKMSGLEWSFFIFLQHPPTTACPTSQTRNFPSSRRPKPFRLRAVSTYLRCRATGLKPAVDGNQCPDHEIFQTKAAEGPLRAALVMVLVTSLSPCACDVLPDMTPANPKLSKQ